MNPVSIRLLSQELCAPRFALPEEVVAHFGAMQAQEYRMMRWAVGMRTRRPSASAFAEAFNSGRIVRLHLLRGTWQLVSREDYGWMLGLCAPKAKQVINGWMSANKIQMGAAELGEIRQILVDVAERMGSATKEDFAQELAARGVLMDDHRLSYHIRFAELDGVLCSGDLLPMKPSYALVSRKLGAHQALDQDEALTLLALKYFQSHSPATLDDFVWWSGLGVTASRCALSLLGSRLEKVRLSPRDFAAARLTSGISSSDKKEFYVLDTARTRGFRTGSYLLLPPYDEYLIGYKSRDLVLSPAHKHRAHNDSGIFQPVVSHDGRIIANWQPFHRTPAPDISFFDNSHIESAGLSTFPSDQHATDALSHTEDALQAAWERYLRFLKG